MKLITDEGKEFNLDSLQPIIIGETQKVIITVDRVNFRDTPIHNIIASFDNFFGEGKWLLTAGDIKLEVKDE